MILTSPVGCKTLASHSCSHMQEAVFCLLHKVLSVKYPAINCLDTIIQHIDFYRRSPLFLRWEHKRFR